MINKVVSLSILSFALAGCTVVPGGGLSTYDKHVIYTKSKDGKSTASKVNVYPLNPDLINQLRNEQIVPTGKANNELYQQLLSYQYHIGPGDVLNVTIWDHPELTIPAGSYRSSTEAGNWVHADGTIYYPYIGKLQVAGKTVSEVRDLIAKKIDYYIEDPQVDVNIAAFRSQKCYVTGEVNDQSEQAITNIPMTILDAINKAGGITKDADWQNVTLTRNGVEQHLSLYALMQKGDLTQNRLLQNGDIIHVPRNDEQKVFVMGEVGQSQVLRIGRTGMSLTEALADAGGIDEKEADATGIFVIRSTAAERIKRKDADPNVIANVYQLDMQDASSLVMGTEFRLQPYDVVYVTAAPVAKWNRLIEQITPSITNFNNLTEGVLRVRTWP